MSFQSTPKQALALWNLLITGEEPAISKVKPNLSPAERKPLEHAGLITLEKRSRSMHIVLTDRAWDWAVENYGVTLSKSQLAVEPLQALLIKLGTHLKSHNISLAEVLRQQPETSKPSEQIRDHSKNSETLEHLEHPLNLSEPLEARILKVYRELGNQNSEIGLRLSKLRQQLQDCPRDEIDQELRRMQSAGKLSLMSMEDPRSIGPEDEQAALDMGGHDKRYFVYIDTLNLY
ncbi:MAG: hypothetical protein ACRC8A_00175 [Microcoleaceae cyanobacterium]